MSEWNDSIALRVIQYAESKHFVHFLIWVLVEKPHLFKSYLKELTSCISKELKIIKRQKQEWKYKASESCSWTPGYTDNYYFLK